MSLGDSRSSKFLSGSYYFNNFSNNLCQKGGSFLQFSTLRSFQSCFGYCSCSALPNSSNLWDFQVSSLVSFRISKLWWMTLMSIWRNSSRSCHRLKAKRTLSSMWMIFMFSLTLKKIILAIKIERKEEYMSSFHFYSRGWVCLFSSMNRQWVFDWLTRGV